MTLEIKPIAHIFTDFPEKFGVPRQSGVCGLVGKIVFEKEFASFDALRGIEGFSHLWLIFDFSMAHKEEFSPTVRPPRLGGKERVGVFATRSPFRPNPLGLSSVRLLRVENENGAKTLIVDGVDMVSGTPIFDIKPYLARVDCHPDATDGFADSVKDHKLAVDFNETLLKLIPSDKRDALVECLAQDPRPSYHEDDREYGLCFANYNIKFRVNGKTLTVLSVENAPQS